jgi:hypothetical protein
MGVGVAMNREKIINGILIGLFGASLGFGGSQMAVVGKVAAIEVHLTNLRSEFSEEKKRTDERIFKLADLFKNHNDLVKAAIEQTSRLLATIEAQNKLIQEQNTLINKR